MALELSGADFLLECLRRNNATDAEIRAVLLAVDDALLHNLGFDSFYVRPAARGRFTERIVKAPGVGMTVILSVVGAEQGLALFVNCHRSAAR